MEHVIIHCPVCGTATAEPMPENACLHRFTCPGCGSDLRPKEGDCCVFCSYGDRQCPSRRAER